MVTTKDCERCGASVVLGEAHTCLTVTGPASPRDVLALKTLQIPQVVFDVFNSEIAKHFDGKSATVKQDDVVDRLSRIPYSIPSKRLFDNHWLDVEKSYEALGWVVEYDQPAYCESYPATYRFTVRP